MQIDLRKIFRRAKLGKLVAILLLLLMLGSTVTSFALQAFNRGRQNGNQESVELPESNIVDYEITDEQKSYLMRQGKTILEYRYQIACANCAEQRAYIEAAANEFSDQIFLQEIVDSQAIRPILEMNSFYGRLSLDDPSTEEILDGLCEIMADPPVRCVTRNI